MKYGRWANWWAGALHVQLRGPGVQSVVTGLQRQGCILQHVRMHANGATLIVSLRDFDTLYAQCRRNGVRIRFIERIGFVFWVRRLRRRKTMVIGPALFIAIIYLCSSIIWQVSIGGVSADTEGTLKEAAADYGVYVGAWKWSVGDLAAVQDRILGKMPSLIWVGASISGSKAKIEAIEKVPGVVQEPKGPQNVIAGKPGVILHVYASRGKVVVRTDQVVAPGQVLITGNLSEDGTQVPAQGQVLAEVWYTSKVTIPLTVSRQGLTGDSVTKDFLVFGSWPVRVWGWKASNFPQAIERSEDTKWRIGGFVLPVQFRRLNVEETTQQAFAQSTADAVAKAGVLALQDVQSQMGADGDVIGQRVLHQEVSHGKLYETVLTKVVQDIGVEKSIPKIQTEHKDDAAGH